MNESTLTKAREGDLMAEQKRYTIPELAEQLTQACAVGERLANIEREIQKISQAIERLLRATPNAHKPDSPKILYSVGQAAHSLACCPATVRQYIKTGMLKAKRSGRTILIHHKDLDSFGQYIREFGPPSVWGRGSDKPWPAERATKRTRGE
jgi:excisionase family DNA binding protein